MWLFEDDICMCGNPDNCPDKNRCERAATRKPGIYSFALFYEEGKECKYFIEIIDKKENKNVK